MLLTVPLTRGGPASRQAAAPQFAPVVRLFLAGDPRLCQQNPTWAGEDRYAQRQVRWQELILIMPRPLSAAGSRFSLELSRHVPSPARRQSRSQARGSLRTDAGLSRSPGCPTARHPAHSGCGAIAGGRSGGRLTRVPPRVSDPSAEL